jgi:tRNA (cmo5U34)-methyltransferase
MESPLNRFDTVAPVYDRLADIVFRGAIRKSQEHFLSSAATSKKTLIVGGGTGLVALKLLQQHPELKITYVEASRKMISISAERCRPFSDRIQFVHGTEADIPEETYDVVITAFFLDMFRQHEVEALEDKILTKLNPGGFWLATDFVNTTSFVHKILLSAMYAFFKIACGIKASVLPEWESALRSRLKLSDSAVFYSGFIKSCRFVYR